MTNKLPAKLFAEDVAKEQGKEFFDWMRRTDEEKRRLLLESVKGLYVAIGIGEGPVSAAVFSEKFSAERYKKNLETHGNQRVTIRCCDLDSYEVEFKEVR